MRMQYVVALLIALMAAPFAAAATSPPQEPGAAASPADQTTGSEEAAKPEAATRKLADKLIYAVNRKPEQASATARAVDVITIEDIWRNGSRSVADLLEEEAGIFLIRPKASGANPVIRGLDAEQAMIMVDGVRINQTTWGSTSKEYLNLIDLGQVERIEIVRGVVSVLGTDSSGGIINIITRKPSQNGDSMGGTVASRYSTADHSYWTPVELHGHAGRLGYLVGGTIDRAQNLRAGSGVGAQQNTSFGDRSGHLNLQYFLSPDRTLAFGYQTLEQRDVKRSMELSTTHFRYFQPARLQLGTLSLEDLSSRPWADSMKVALYWNRQDDKRDEIRRSAPTTNRLSVDTDTALGLTAEFNKFFGSNHMVYGTDYSNENIDSTRHDVSLTDDSVAIMRGRFLDGAKYRSYGVFVNDDFSVGNWLTVNAGLRYSGFQATANLTSPILGELSVDAADRGLSTSTSLIFHLPKGLNLIANLARGARSPNFDTFDSYTESTTRITIPAEDINQERVRSYELGLKYNGATFGGSAFYYNNKFSELVQTANGLYRGLPFYDLNGNGTQDKGELAVRFAQNLGKQKVTGYELDAHYNITSTLSMLGDYTSTKGTNILTDIPLSRIPPAFGKARILWAPSWGRSPWGEIVYKYARAQHRLSASDISSSLIGPNGSPSYGVFNLRGGLDLSSAVKLSVGLDNVTNERYRSHGSAIWEPGRSLVVGTQWKF